jgi:hypothetical protein
MRPSLRSNDGFVVCLRGHPRVYLYLVVSMKSKEYQIIDNLVLGVVGRNAALTH